jgi:spore germination protein YaaH
MTRPVPFSHRAFALLGLVAITFTSFVPFADAKTSAKKLEVSGWIPYWAGTKGINDAQTNLSKLTEINPFGYTVRADGTLYDNMNVGSASWQGLFKDARKKGVKVIPTIMWSDGAAIHATLSDTTKRKAHVDAIARTVKSQGFDGIDIDYEGKRAETRPYFSAFLTELNTALEKQGKNITLHCTIEARMPLEARYSGTPPANIEYANDLPTLNKVCDRVRVMTYDQQTADVQLNAKYKGQLYAPVADVAWVEKVVKYMSRDISKDKLSVGIATYGYIWQAMSNTSGTGYSYTKTEAFNPQYGWNVAKEYGLTPSRNPSGELMISYVPKETSSLLPSQNTLASLAPKGTASSNLAAAGALAYSKKQGKQAPVQFLTWSDSVAIGQKVDLAKKLGVRGVSVFKIDGGEDPKMWSVLK